MPSPLRVLGELGGFPFVDFPWPSFRTSPGLLMLVSQNFRTLIAQIDPESPSRLATPKPFLRAPRVVGAQCLPRRGREGWWQCPAPLVKIIPLACRWLQPYACLEETP